VADTTITSDVHQSFDVHLHFASQRTFDLVLRRDDAANLRRLVICQITDLSVDIDARLVQNRASSCAPDTVDGRQANLRMFLLWQIDTSYASQTNSSLALTLFMFRICTDHAYGPLPPDNLAQVTHFLD